MNARDLIDALRREIENGYGQEEVKILDGYDDIAIKEVTTFEDSRHIFIILGEKEDARSISSEEKDQSSSV